MSGKTFIFRASLATIGLVIAVAVIPRNRAVEAEIVAGAAVDTFTATVEVGSLRVISYLDDDGVEHPADSSLVPPSPVRGPREFTVTVDRRPAAAPLAVRAGLR